MVKRLSLVLAVLVGWAGCRTPSGPDTRIATEPAPGIGGGPPVRIASFQSVPESYAPGSRIVLWWRTADADQCAVSPGIGRLHPSSLTSGSLTFVAAHSEYRLVCRGGGATARARAGKKQDTPPRIDYFLLDPVAPSYGAAVTLSWHADAGARCEIDPDVGPVAGSGRHEMRARAPGRYFLVCGNGAGAVERDVWLQVRGAVINEVAWMGTRHDAADEWIELHNTALSRLDLTGWTLGADDGSPAVQLAGSIAPGGYFLLERTNDDSVRGVKADLIFAGALENGGEALTLRDPTGYAIDRVAGWYAGDVETKSAMERRDPLGRGDEPANWRQADIPYDGGRGTPRSANSAQAFPHGGTAESDFRAYFAQHWEAELPPRAPAAMALAIAEALDDATRSVDFALYGAVRVPAVFDALERAAARGLALRGVIDSDVWGGYAYPGGEWLWDGFTAASVKSDGRDSLMHHKFLIIDQARVWFGSANVSDAGVGGEYNCNFALLWDGADVAAAFSSEFDELFEGRFGTAKLGQSAHLLARRDDGTLVEVYFGPIGGGLAAAVIRAIDLAKTEVMIISTYLTHPDVETALLAAHARGVRIRVITDAAAAAGAKEPYEALREAGIEVKIEDWPGKAHTKGLQSDGFRVVLGSQNWSLAGDTRNDEHIVYVENGPLAERFARHFERDWGSIPLVWSSGVPGAESTHAAKSLADFIDNDHDGFVDEGAPGITPRADESDGAMNAYFNKRAVTATTYALNAANAPVSLQERLVYRIATARRSVDMAAYEINLPQVVDALLERAAAGVRVRLVVDAKVPPADDAGAIARYRLMRVQLEVLARGRDGRIGTADDVRILGDGPILAARDRELRAAWGLPLSPVQLAFGTVTAGTTVLTGHLLALGEAKAEPGYFYAFDDAMHHKFLIIDDEWVWTGSFNFTLTSEYGDEPQQRAGAALGNTDAAVEFRSPSVAGAYRSAFEAMWGGPDAAPVPSAARFHGRKPVLGPFNLQVRGSAVDIYFSPGSGAMEALSRLVAEEADRRAYFAVYAWSHQALVDAFKLKWEGSALSGVGTKTGFDLRGVFDRAAWGQWWSASQDMLGRTVTGTTNNPNVRWANPPPIFASGEDRKLHGKLLVLDDDGADATVVFGSTNWGENGDSTNDDDMVIVRDVRLADQFRQFLDGIFYRAGGTLIDREN